MYVDSPNIRPKSNVDSSISLYDFLYFKFLFLSQIIYFDCQFKFPFKVHSRHHNQSLRNRTYPTVNCLQGTTINQNFNWN